MLEKNLEIKSEFSRALIAIKEQQTSADVKFESLAAIVADLRPVNTDLGKLCNQNTTLLIAKGGFAFIIGELNQQNSGFAKNMKYSLDHYISERRNVSLRPRGISSVAQIL